MLKEECVWVTYFINTGVARGQDRVEVKSMINLVLVKKDKLHYLEDVRAVRGIGQGLSDHHVELFKVRLVGAWTKRREVVVGARRIRSEKLSEHKHKERYPRSLEVKGVE